MQKEALSSCWPGHICQIFATVQIFVIWFPRCLVAHRKLSWSKRRLMACFLSTRVISSSHLRDSHPIVSRPNRRGGGCFGTCVFLSDFRLQLQSDSGTLPPLLLLRACCAPHLLRSRLPVWDLNFQSSVQLWPAFRLYGGRCTEATSHRQGARQGSEGISLIRPARVQRWEWKWPWHCDPKPSLP